MPIYEYRCRNCGHIFELFQSINADISKLVCPECQTLHPERLFSAFAAGGSALKTSSSTSSDAGCGSGGFT